MGTVQKFVDGFNKSSAAAIAATCDSQAGIIDDFPPHAWMSCATWWNDFLAFSKQDGDTNWNVTLGPPAHVNITGNLAYVVVPTTYVYVHHGKKVTMVGSAWTLVLKNSPAGWHITAWAWADGK